MTLNCFKCKAEVVFDSEHIGKNGKKIPLDPATHTPHDCPMREKMRTANDPATMGGVVDLRDEGKDDHHSSGTSQLLEKTYRYSPPVC